MGAFLALRRDRNRDSTSEAASRISKCFSAQGFLGRQLIESSSWHILVYRKFNCDHQNFLIEDSDYRTAGSRSEDLRASEGNR